MPKKKKARRSPARKKSKASVAGFFKFGFFSFFVIMSVVVGLKEFYVRDNAETKGISTEAGLEYLNETPTATPSSSLTK
jgi:hypothetical protein